MQEINGGCYLRQLLEFIPRLLHLFGVMYIVYCNNSLGVNMLEQLVHIAHGSIVGMIGIYKGEIDFVAR